MVWFNDAQHAVKIKKSRDELFVQATFDIFDQLESMGFESREGQFNLALDIAEAIRDKRKLMVEAGVGIGKSLGYLIPGLILSKYSFKPIIIATSTIQLTEQLQNDVKLASSIAGIPAMSIVGKGRNNYACQDKVLQNLSNLKDIPKWITDWVVESNNQDRGEAPKPIENKIWDRISVDKCKFEKCDYKQNCRFYMMREAIKGFLNHNVIIVNQDLLIANLLRVSEGYSAFITENHSLLVIDEAHNLEEKTRNALTKEWGLKKVEVLLKDVTNLLSRRYDFKEIKELIKHSKKEVNDLFSDFWQFAKNELNQSHVEHSERINIGLLKYNPTLLIDYMYAIRDRIELHTTFDEREQEELLSKVIEFTTLLTELDKQTSSNLLFWAEIGKHKNLKSLKICFAPKDIAGTLNEILFEHHFNKPVILTSATLTQPGNTLEEKYKYQMDSIGYQEDVTEPKESPFPYNLNSRLYIPNGIAHPTNEKKQYLNQITEEILKLGKITQGRTLVLFTSKEDLDTVYNNLIVRESALSILKQIEGSNQNSIIDEFIHLKGILLSTGVFWEGINIKGLDLSSVIVTRLPFPVPDPIINYKTQQSKDGFNEVILPEMITKLRQGAGRLIRSEFDKGLLTILDQRVSDAATNDYKHRVLDALPIKNKLTNLQDVKAFFNQEIIPYY
ncbi:ATP-dependent DNA helicase [Alkalihalobacillus sp. BA299]|uniref:ATP-dependent DNA helicase n=1 Tax=Alkalihalobacillus sp. BA299 TaxID=2815938 RepID=UPI001ADB9AC8|nr:ATP-dependent DNA helicase [Alkalihalobacillus sp. BA299]